MRRIKCLFLLGCIVAVIGSTAFGQAVSGADRSEVLVLKHQV